MVKILRFSSSDRGDLSSSLTMNTGKTSSVKGMSQPELSWKSKVFGSRDSKLKGDTKPPKQEYPDLPDIFTSYHLVCRH